MLYNDSDVLQTPPQPEPLFIDNVELHIVTEAKILGVVIQANLKWNNHILQVVNKCDKKNCTCFVYSLRRFNISLIDLITVYSGYIPEDNKIIMPVCNKTKSEIRNRVRLISKQCQKRMRKEAN